jgi:hypothetical protein
VAKIGEGNLSILILSAGFGLTFGLCSLSGAGKVTGSSSFNGCIGHTHKFEVACLIIFRFRSKSSD